jgi:hypothetical protein
VYVGGSCPGELGEYVDRSTVQPPLEGNFAIGV